MKIANLQHNIIRNLPFRAETQIEQKTSDKEAISFAKKHKDEKFSFPVLATTIAGTVIPMLIIRKYQIKQGKLQALNTNALKSMDFKTKAKTILKSFDIKYEMKEMLYTAFGSVAGGLAGGLLFDKNKDKHTKKVKIKEAVFQMFNVSIPIIIGDQIVKFTDKRNLKSGWVKLLTAVLAVGAGMPIAAKISNTINSNVVDKQCPDRRKLRVRDAFVHLDDFVGVLVLSKIPLIDKLHVDKILPVLYGTCGYEAGTKQH